MKVMDKAQILEERMVDQVLNERFMMAALHYPLVVNLRFAAQDPVDLFLVVDLMLGGDVRYHMKNGRPFDFDRVRFYTAQTALAINYLHEQGYIHRDIKPDNLLLDASGNVHLTDFNLSIKKNDTRRRGVVGTRSYMAPEVVGREEYNEMVDWWSLGVCIYEWSFGAVPFRGNQTEQRDAILTAEPRYPSPVDRTLRSLISSLLRKDPAKRADFQKIKDHPYFEGVDWDALENKTAIAPWKPDATRANCDGTYDLDEQFQVKKKRPPIVSTEFDVWDWKPGQEDDMRTPRSARRNGASATQNDKAKPSNHNNNDDSGNEEESEEEEEAEVSFESDDPISDERGIATPATFDGSTEYADCVSHAGTSDSIPIVGEQHSRGTTSDLSGPSGDSSKDILNGKDREKRKGRHSKVVGSSEAANGASSGQPDGINPSDGISSRSSSSTAALNRNAKDKDGETKKERPRSKKVHAGGDSDPESNPTIPTTTSTADNSKAYRHSHRRHHAKHATEDLADLKPQAEERDENGQKVKKDKKKSRTQEIPTTPESKSPRNATSIDGVPTSEELKNEKEREKHKKRRSKLPESPHRV